MKHGPSENPQLKLGEYKVTSETWPAKLKVGRDEKFILIRDVETNEFHVVWKRLDYDHANIVLGILSANGIGMDVTKRPPVFSEKLKDCGYEVCGGGRVMLTDGGILRVDSKSSSYPTLSKYQAKLEKALSMISSKIEIVDDVKSK